jgi:flagellar basal body-associated protein FliL
MAKKSNNTNADAASADAPVESAEKEAKRKLSLPKPVIYVLVILIQVVAAYYLQKTFLFGDSSGTAVAKPAAEEKKESESKEGEEGGSDVVLLDEIIVNPADTGGRRYLAVTVGFQSSLKEAEKAFEKNKPILRDALISLLSSKHLDQLSNIAYRDSLKFEIKEIVNTKMHAKAVDTVVFSNYVLQ